MRDPRNSVHDSYAIQSLSRLRDLPFLLTSFVRNPVGTMRIPMRLTWPACISLQAGTAIVSGVLAGALAHNFWDFLTGLILFPLTSLAIGFIYSGFIFSFFSIFMNTFLDFRRLHSIVVVALIPYFALHIFSGFVPPMDLLGFGLTALLLIVGLVEQFSLPRKPVITIMSAISIAFFVVWSAAQVKASGGGRIPSSTEAPHIVVPGPQGPPNSQAPASETEPKPDADPNL